MRFKVVLILMLFQIFLSWQNIYAAVRLDFDGDGKTDPTVLSAYSLGNQTWQVLWHNLKSKEGYGVAVWGGADQNPNGFADFYVPEDYDGDGKTDFAVWRRPFQSGQQSYFYILYSATGTYAVIPWGLSPGAQGTFEEVPQDYDGDGKADVAVTRSTPQGLLLVHSPEPRRAPDRTFWNNHSR